MTITPGQSLPASTLSIMGPEGPEDVDLSAKLKGRKVVIFAVPGAFSGTCSTMHVPSFIRTKKEFDAKGVDEIICISVNDPFVMQAWSVSTGANEAGITMLADSAANFTKSIGMEYTIPPIGFYDRSKRYSMLVEDGVVTILNPEVARGTCEMSGGETLLAQL